MSQVYLALGSNLAEPRQQINAALSALRQLPESQLTAVSSFYRTPPYGPAGQPDYLNAVVSLDTRLSPETLLDATQHIEQQQGRIRCGERWGPRTLDIDILLFDNRVLNTPRLTVPHYDMHNRAFMLVPLLEIAPDCTLPDGTAISTLLSQLDIRQIHLW
ncbi:MAG: 2-amino-4-hydroxy-6-hydroxymethyldihydropteridinepyrophosphokinase [Candidatus Erwinia impunctatus]|nr:2-amino-4-hydroxy-6-hydroxymethyldihydropteridinepyrophosphokinase [Culicoides impunctatus]